MKFNNSIRCWTKIWMSGCLDVFHKIYELKKKKYSNLDFCYLKKLYRQQFIEAKQMIFASSILSE